MAVRERLTGALEARLLRLDERYGTAGVVGVITGWSLLLAEGLTALSCVVTPTPAQFVVLALCIAGVVTLSVAPLSSYLIVRLLHDLAVAHAELHTLAHRDALTGLHNRRSFFSACDRLLGDGVAAGPAGVRPLVVMADLDHFKALNDTHGHATGDAALVELASRLLEVVGDDGVVARLGGDEFAAVLRLPEADHVERMTRLRRACTGVTAAPGVAVDGSIGSFAIPDGMELDEALHRADLALYRDKAQRRAQRV